MYTCFTPILGHKFVKSKQPEWFKTKFNSTNNLRCYLTKFCNLMWSVKAAEITNTVIGIILNSKNK